jgi:hypothetical protein
MRLTYSATLPVGNPDRGAEAEIELTVDIDPDPAVLLRDAVIFVDPTEDELRSFYGLRDSALDRACDQAECVRYEMERSAAIAAESAERARAESRRIIDDFLTASAMSAQFELAARLPEDE